SWKKTSDAAPARMCRDRDDPRKQLPPLGPSMGVGSRACWGRGDCKFLAEREGFEPPIRLPVCRISSAVRSTTLPPLRRGGVGPRSPVVAHVVYPSCRGRTRADRVPFAARPG